MSVHAEHDIVMAYLSVCPSVSRWYCMETNVNIVKLFVPSGKGMALVFRSI